ncbi:hypothetical protein RUM43_005150 [Polyplax serrata]|uniref:Uncharacterized protein n=1 Tax=Polyplax serrata TaxID=468196 RepID=A0AAN8SF91_POLSC
MQKICVILLSVTLIAVVESVTQGKWSLPIRDNPSGYTRHRRQFVFGEWIPLSKSCPTCRTLVDPQDVNQRTENTDLTPPRAPTVTRQIHTEGNFFSHDDSAVLSVPPPPPGFAPHSVTSSGSTFQNIQFPNFRHHFGNSVPTLPSSQPVSFLQQPFVTNQNLLVNTNQPSLPTFSQTQLGQQKFTENVVLGGSSSTLFPNTPAPFRKQQPILQQNQQSQGFSVQQGFSHQKPFPPAQGFRLQHGFSQQQTFPNQQQGFAQPPQGFTEQKGFALQQKTFPQQVFTQQQTFSAQEFLQKQQQQQPVLKQQHFEDSILTPPPVANISSQNVVLPGLNKEEVQLLYVPVEALRQRGTIQQQLPVQQQQQRQHPQQQINHFQQNIELQGRPSTGTKTSGINFLPTEATLTSSQQPKGHFVAENKDNQTLFLTTLQVSSVHPFSTSSTPSPIFFDTLSTKATPHPFVSATPITSTPTPFITTTSFPQTFTPVSSNSPLAHLSTVQNNVEFNNADLQFVTTQKTLSNEEGLREEIVTAKPPFSRFHHQQFGQQFTFQQHPQLDELQKTVQLQTFVGEAQKQGETQSHQNKSKQGQNTSFRPTVVKQQSNNQPEFTFRKQQEKTPYVQQSQLQQQEESDLKLYQKEIENQQSVEQQKQNGFEGHRYVQKPFRQNESQEQIEKKGINEQKYLQAQEQKNAERERQKQRQNELKEQQRQNELEEQRRIQELRQLDEQRRLQLKQREQDEKNSFRLQQQHSQQESGEQTSQRPKQNTYRKQPEFYHQQQRQSLQQVQQHIAQQPTHEQQRNVFSESDNNFVSQVEKEAATETPELVPHQPPLSVFYKGFGKSQSRIGDVLRELRSSTAITVLDQYFEKMPKIFVGPAGLLPPAGYDKYDLPYLSNIESQLADKNSEKLPFFVAPLNFVPPFGYSKIPFPSPHVGSVVISTDPISETTIKPTAVEISTINANERAPSFLLVGPELPGLINSLESDETTVRVTTPTLPQTTAQIRNRRPNNNIYRTRKPVSKIRSTTTTTTTTTTIKPEEITKKSENSDGLFRKPFNGFLKRRRQQVKSTTEASSKQHSESSKTEDSRQFQSKKQIANVGGGGKQYGSQVFDRTSSTSQDDYEIQPVGYKFRQSSSSLFSRQRGNTKIIPEENNLQSFEEGPVPTGSAKTVAQELYKPNAARPKLESKLDSTTISGKLFYSEEADVPQTAGYLKLSKDKSNEFVQTTAASFPDSQYTSVPTSIKVEADRAGYSKTDHPSLGHIHGEEQLATTEYIGLDDSYTSAFVEISKHHHIPRPQDGTKVREKQKPSSGGLAIELQAPHSGSYSSEQNSEEFVESGDGVTPANSLFVSEGYSQSETNEDSQSEEEHKFDVSNEEENVTAGDYTGNYKTTVTGAQVIALNSHNYVTESTSQRDGVTTVKSWSHEVQINSNDESENKAVPKIKGNETSEQSPEEVQSVEIENDSSSTSQTSDESLFNPSKLKSGVRVRTRLRSNQRLRENNSRSQSSSPRKTETEEEYRVNTEEQYQENLKTQQPNVSKYNFRGIKKPLRKTHEGTTEIDQNVNVYTIKPHKRPFFASTVSTKRIRRPTTPTPVPKPEEPLSSIPTLVTYQPDSEEENSEISGSGVSNEVFFESTGRPLIRPKFRQTHTSSEKQLNVAPSTFRPTEHLTFVEEETTKEDDFGGQALGTTELYPQWNPPDSNIDVSGIVLTTTGSTETEKEIEGEEEKKNFENKKAFDPDLEKKGGRRRVKVKVHRRPHENFETAESQNLRTVANVLVPPTSTYKPVDEGSLHVSSKSSYAGQKSFGSRSREYFKKRLNITLPDARVEFQKTESSDIEIPEQVTTAPEITDHNNGSHTEEGKVIRPKVRGFVRKVIKHPLKTDGEQTMQQGVDDDSDKQSKFVHLGSFNNSQRFNGVRHKTLIRYIKKNKLNTLDGKTPENGEQKETEFVESQEEKTHHENTRKLYPVFGTTTTLQSDVQQEDVNVNENQQLEETGTTEMIKEHHQLGAGAEELYTTVLDRSTDSVQTQSTERPIIGRGTTKLFPVLHKLSSKVTEEEQQTESTGVKPTDVRGTYKSRFFQTLRPVYQRAPNTGVLRIRDNIVTSTTESYIPQQNEKRTNKYKYNKGISYGTTTTTASKEDTDHKKSSEEQNTKTKTLFGTNRKYLRAKTKEGGFGQFSRSRYSTSSKTDTSTTFEETTNFEYPTTESEFKTSQNVATADFSLNDFNSRNPEFDYTTKEPTTIADLESSQEENNENGDLSNVRTLSTTELLTTYLDTTVEDKTEVPTSSFVPNTSEDVIFPTTELTGEQDSTGNTETPRQPDLYSFGKHSFSFDEAEKFTGTKNRGYVRNITADIIENTSSFSAPGVEQRDAKFSSHVVGTESHETTTQNKNESETEETPVEPATVEIATDEETTEATTLPPATSVAIVANQAEEKETKISKLVKTSTTTKVSHETEICYRGRCIRTKSENPEEDLKQLVDSEKMKDLEKIKA